MGTLKIIGRLDLKQFWPQGKGDADTTQLKIKVDHAAFEFTNVDDYNSNTYAPTHAFDLADVVSQGQTSTIIKYRASKNRSYIKVRLQGIDAPELHYKIYDNRIYRNLSDDQKIALQNANIEYRQKFAETAVTRLKNYIENRVPGADAVDIVFLSKNIDEPADVVDVYGRFVGDILLVTETEHINLNDWILGNGLAFPAFYNSMFASEVLRMKNLNTAARQQKISATNVWTYFSKPLKKFEYKLVFQNKGIPIEHLNSGDVILFPKVYRRYCVYSIYKKAGMPKANTFAAYLKQKTEDKYIELSDFMQGNNIKKKFYLIHDHGSLERNPEDIIFVEKVDMKLVRSGTNIEITSF